MYAVSPQFLYKKKISHTLFNLSFLRSYIQEIGSKTYKGLEIVNNLSYVHGNLM